MSWQYLTDYSEPTLGIGSLLRFEASYPLEDEVIMMICEASGYDFAYGLKRSWGINLASTCLLNFHQIK